MILKTAERIHMLREQSGMTQQDLALRLGVTRSSVNSWEMGISTPTTDKIAELAQLFKTSSDYILGITSEKTLQMDLLSMDQQELVYHMIQYFDKVHALMPLPGNNDEKQ
jgi:transcriptional regulator with XRE-family HTH domain